MSAAEQHQKSDLLTGPIAPTLRRMTLPMIMALITMMSFNLVDTYFIGQLGTRPLAAISFTFPVTFTVISLSIGLGIGTSAVVARLIGQRQYEQAKIYGGASIWLSSLLVAALSAVGFWLRDPLFALLGASAATRALIMQYMDIWFAGSVLLIIPMIANAVLRAGGETRLPSLVMAGSGVLNALFDPLLIFGLGPFPRMELAGAAVASLCSWLVGSIDILVLIVRQQRVVLLPLPLKVLWQAWKAVCRIGLPAAAANMLTPLANALMTALVATMGPAVVAAYGVGARLESISSLVVLSLSMTLPPLISQNFGAGQLSRVGEAYRKVIGFVMVWQLVVYGALCLLLPWITQAFAPEPKVAEVLKWFVWVMPLSYGMQGIIILTNSSFNALHRPMAAMIMSVLRFFIFFIPLSFLGAKLGDVPGLFIGGALANLLTGSVAWQWFNRLLRTYKERGAGIKENVDA